jgi:DNA anti-recombination protein RmuC
MMAHLLAEMKAEMKADQEEMKAEIRARQEEMKEEMLAKMEARIKANNEKFEILRDTLVSWIDDHHERMTASVNA